MTAAKNFRFALPVSLAASAFLLIALASSALADTAPQVTISAPNGITTTSAHLHGEVNPENGPSETEWRFEYSIDDSAWSPVSSGGTLPGTDESFHPVEAELTGLNPGTKYFVRLVAADEGGANATTSAGPDPSFTTHHGPAWRIDTIANTNAAPRGTQHYEIQLTNLGDENADGTHGDPIVLKVSLPEGITAEELSFWGIPFFNFNMASWTCESEEGGGPIEGSHVFSCEIPNVIGSRYTVRPSGFIDISPNAILSLKAHVSPFAHSFETAEFEVSGGGAKAPATTVDPTTISSEPAPFGIDAFDADQKANAAGETSTAAAAHPYSSFNALEFNSSFNAEALKGFFFREFESESELEGVGVAWPSEPEKDAYVDLPPGLVGNPTVAGECTQVQLSGFDETDSAPVCPPSSQVGTVMLRFNNASLASLDDFGPIPVYQMHHALGSPASFGFNFADTIITVDAKLRNGTDYGLSVDSRNIVEPLPTVGTSFEFWGVPSNPVNTPDRGCPGSFAPWNSQTEHPEGCASELEGEERALLRNPTSCTMEGEALATSVHTDSWFNPGSYNEDGTPNLSDPAWKSETSFSHEPPGYPYFPHGKGHDQPGLEGGAEVGIEGCSEVPFTPEIEVAPTTNRADSPTGLEVDLTMPQSCWAPGEFTTTCQADLKRAEVALPVGMAVNPSAADGQGACTSAEIGLLGTEFGAPAPIRFDAKAPSCPDSSKIGTVQIDTPLLEEPVKGSVYLAKQGDNPFGSLLALYVVASDPDHGILLKLPGKIEADPQTGQLRTVFDNQPQLPFSHFHLEFFGGARAPLVNPPTCGTFTTQASFSGWANPTEAVSASSPFTLTQGPGGAACPSKPLPLSPQLRAGSASPLAGVFTSLTTRLFRDDGTQRMAGLRLTLPPGLTGKLAGIPYCPDSALAAIPTGDASLGLGALELAHPHCPAASRVGIVRFGTGAGPTPRYGQTGDVYLAGPYKGAPLSLAVVSSVVDGPFDFGNVVVRTALHVDPETTRITGVSDPIPTILDGIPIDLRDLRVEMERPDFILNPTSCDPMSVDATVAGEEGATANPSDHFQIGECGRLGFKPKLSFRLKGKTNRGAHPALTATLQMPEGGANIARAAVTLPPAEILDNGHIRNVCTHVQFEGSGCPAGSVLGFAKAETPLLEKPLEGPVYLMSGFGHKLPDVAADLNGQIRVLLHGKVDTGPGGGIRNTFEVVPDAPVSRFTLSLKGGKRGLIQNSANTCASPQRATVLFDGQNGKTADSHPALKVAGCHNNARKRHSRRG
jgi:hypothetical protein